MEVFEKIIIPIITLIVGLFGGIHYEKNKVKQKILGDNKGNMVGRDIKNVHNKK